MQMEVLRVAHLVLVSHLQLMKTLMNAADDGDAEALAEIPESLKPIPQAEAVASMSAPNEIASYLSSIKT